AYAAGLLRPEDILLTDGVPAETPLVAGIISLTPSTPNSHVAILSASFGIPFVYLPDPDERERVFALAGREVVVRAYSQFGRCEVDVIDVDGTMSAETKAALLALKYAPPIRFMPKTSFGAISASTDTFTPADIRFFGGKAANYGLLRQWVPSNCPPAIALSFDVWDAFLDQTLPGGNTLRAEIAARLASYTNFPPPISALKADLAAIRDLFTRIARFTPAQQQAITNALRVFNPGRNIRFRSSTNVEDSEHFTGAGLYDSFSGCLLDDHDGDTAGPSHCDPTENNERGVFRAIQRVYASFYNDNAFLERLRHGVDETKVGMGVLVHHSFPDAEELANGVATLTFSFFSFGTNITGDLVTQYGATPVTNPDGSAVPEVVDAARFGSTISVDLQQHSSLVPLGAYVMDWRDDYVEFMRLFTQVGYGFKQFYPAKNNFLLDFEYKKDVNLGLVVKQVREVPRPPATNAVPFLVDDPVAWCVDQQEFGDAFSNHRLKSLWTLNTKAMRLFPSNLTQSIYRDGAVEYLSGTNRLALTGVPATWPNASNSLAGELATDFWTTGAGSERRDWRLQTTLLLSVSSARPPIVTSVDLRKSVMVTYATPVPALDDQARIVTRTNETVRLVPCRQLHPGAILEERTLVGTNIANGKRVTVQTSYYWPKPPGASAGYTAPLVQFVETRINGLTTNEIVLHDYYSQTYRPGHHNFDEEFIFEPRLDPQVSPAILQELNAVNVGFIYIHLRLSGRAEFTILGTDGILRRW
ncbi:MAG TPA: PEP/pyruvate-binding domain-containing protein, partial [Verrucomicrobiae bacterium]|nr:PEP/pyruvate-binding domain-containing protein [Verrucomicrobiae bacterium]